jgi:uncharacterized protein
MLFEWNAIKNLTNQQKHGIAFESAKVAFEDIFRLIQPDVRYISEPRWKMTAQAEDMLMVVAYTVRTRENGQEVIRIISARRSSQKERREYNAARRSGHRD